MTISLSLFQAHTGSYFDIFFDNQQQLRLQLQEVSLKPCEPGYQAFSLLFFCDGIYQLEQNTYPLQHPELGENKIFLVPVAQQGTGVLYQATYYIKAE